jgi:hypothetical protein
MNPGSIHDQFAHWICCFPGNSKCMYTQKANRKDVHVDFKCTHLEKKYLQVCAKKAGLTPSHYLRGMMLQGYPKKPKVIPEEIQTMVGRLMEVAALLHPFSRKRLDAEDFNALERAEARQVIRQVEMLIQQIKNLNP